jgi:hypothetical protein
MKAPDTTLTPNGSPPWEVSLRIPEVVGPVTTPTTPGQTAAALSKAAGPL